MATLATAALVSSIAGGAISTISQFQAAQFNKAVARRNTQLALQKGEAEAKQFAKQKRAEQGQRIANIAASGIQFEGSPLAILQQSAIEDELGRLRILQGAQVSAGGFQAEAGQFGREATQEILGGGVGVASSILRDLKK